MAAARVRGGNDHSVNQARVPVREANWPRAVEPVPRGQAEGPHGALLA